MVTSSIARNETNRILENAIGNVRSYPGFIWPVCRFKTRDFAFVLPLLVAAWYRFHTDNFDRRNKGKVFLFFQLHANLRVSILFFSFFSFSFYTKNSRIHPFDIDADLRKGERRKEGKIRVYAIHSWRKKPRIRSKNGGSSFECAETSESLHRVWPIRSSHFCCVWFNFS